MKIVIHSIIPELVLFLWVLGCILFYATLDPQTLYFILPSLPLKPILLVCLGSALFLLFLPTRPRLSDHPFFIFPIPLLILFVFFLKKFPPTEYGSLIFQDDFTSLYAASLRTLRMFREGALFGWDNRLLGGYYTISDLNFNLGLFTWPFYLLFGAPVGYHLFIATLFFGFPFLVYQAARLLDGDQGVAGVAFWISSFFAISFFRNILFWGNLDNLLGIDLFLLVLTALKKSEQSPKAFFWLSLLLTSLAYAHLAYFCYALVVVGCVFVTPSRRKHLFYFCLVGVVVLLATLPYTIHFFAHPHSFELDAKHYHAARMTFQEGSAQSFQKISWLTRGRRWLTAGYEGSHGGNYGAAAVLLFPFLLLTSWMHRRSRVGILGIFLILCTLPLKTGFALALKRSYFLLPILLSLSLAQGIKTFFARRHVAVCVVVPALLLGTVGLPALNVIPHVRTLASFFPDLYRRLSSLDGHTIFLETQALWIETDRLERGERFPGPHVHMEMLLALETGKRYLAHGKDGYPFSVYRQNCLMSGIWAGKFLNEYSVKEVNAFLKKWGVRYLAVWSDRSRRFFSAHPDFYEEVWKNDPWSLFRFKGADSRSVVVPSGEGGIAEESYTQMVVRLKNVRRGEEAIVRMNYFPGFRLFCDGGSLPFYPHDGQVAFQIPREGEITVFIRYPRYLFLSVIGLAALLGMGVFVWRKK